MADQQAWDDWTILKSSILGAEGIISTQFLGVAGQLESLKLEILDNVQRRNAMLPIGNQHPVFRVPEIEDRVKRILDLADFLKANGW